MLQWPFRYCRSFMYAAVSYISYIAECYASWEKESSSVAILWASKSLVWLLCTINSNFKKAHNNKCLFASPCLFAVNAKTTAQIDPNAQELRRPPRRVSYVGRNGPSKCSQGDIVTYLVFPSWSTAIFTHFPPLSALANTALNGVDSTPHRY